MFIKREQLVACIPEGSWIVEIGVDRGRFSQVLLDCRPRRLDLVDIWESGYYDYGDDHDKKHETVLEWASAHENICVHRRSSFEFLQEHSGKSIDFIYLDADHSFESVLRELELCKSVIKADGVIAGHDFFDYEASRASRNLPSREKVNVQEAVSTFLTRNSEFGLFLVTGEAQPSFFLCRKKFLLESGSFAHTYFIRAFARTGVTVMLPQVMLLKIMPQNLRSPIGTGFFMGVSL